MFDSSEDSEDISIGSEISDDDDDDDDAKDLVNIKLKKITIQIKYSQLCKYSQLIRTKYLIYDANNNLSKDIQEFQQQNSIQDENIFNFFKFLCDEKCKITKDRYRDFFKLSQFFQVKKLLKILKKYSKTHFNNVDLRIQFILDEIEEFKNNNSEECYKYKISSQMEEYLTNNIEKCIKSVNFGKLPISIIYRIIEKSDREKINGDLLYDFISKSIDKFKVLFHFLDLSKFSDEKLFELFDFYNNSKDQPEKFSYFQNIPCNLPYLMKLKEEIKQLNDINSDLQKTIERKTNENENLKNQSLQYLNKIKRIEEEKAQIIANFNKSNEEYSRGINSIFGSKNERKMKTAVEYLKISSEKGNCYSSYLLGILHECGEGVEQDTAKMIEYYEKSSEQGNSHGLNRIGYCYKIGYVLSMDHSKAFEYYQKGSDLGNSYSMNNLAVLYDEGNVVDRDMSKTFELYKKSAALGNSYALRNLGNMYLKGNFVEQDYSKAIEYYQMSADANDSYSLIILGDIYAKGIGVQKNILKAFEYYSKADDLDDPDAKAKIRRLTKQTKK